MIEDVDYRKYLSIDNGKGLLISKSDAFILEQYGINYYDCSSISDLMLIINRFIDDNEIIGENSKYKNPVVIADTASI